MNTVPRAYALDLLPAIRSAKAEVFIKTIEDEAFLFMLGIYQQYPYYHLTLEGAARSE